MSRKLLFLSLSAIAIGAVIFFIGCSVDPFLIPFQDYNDIPRAQQIAYEQRHAWAIALDWVGFALAAAGIIALAYRLFQRKLR